MDRYNGLNEKQIKQSRNFNGSNELTKKEREGFLKRYLASFGDPIIRILLIALAVNVLLMFRDANWYESAGIAIAVLIATLIATLSEMGSEKAFDKLQEDAANIKCRVRRDGKISEIPIGEIVVGDIVLLGAGERIPADGVLIQNEIEADQSALNGESKEARKTALPTDPLNLADLMRDQAHTDFSSPHGLFRGTVVCAGEGEMIVTRVGDGTFYGQLAEEIQEATIISPLKERLTALAKTISRFGYAAAIIVVIANLFNSIVLQNNFNPAQITAHLADRHALIRDALTAITLGITVIVMAVPEGLPMMITVVLSANMRRMLKDNVLVRKLVGIETSGSMNILFTDKTGTLTQGALTVASFITSTGKHINADAFKKTPLYRRAALNCFYNNSAALATVKLKTCAIGGNSTDRALLDYVKEKAVNLPLCEKGNCKPFNSKEKMSITAVCGEFDKVLFKGAPEILLPACKYAFSENDEFFNKKPFEATPDLKAALQYHAQNGMRLLAICESESETPANLTLVGFIGIRDEIRPQAPAAIKEIQNASIQVVMVTGDNLDTAVHVAKKLGLDGEAITSRALNRLSDTEARQLLPKLSVIARALPSDKGRLVRIAQEAGMVAGMTGDGVNDSPALKKADVGFVMGSGTEIAKEAGDVVILDNNIASIAKAVLYGRTIFKSIRKFLIFQLTINLCAVGVSVIGPFIGIPVPVTVIQMLWINMIMDTLAGLAYAGEAPLKEYMREAPKRRSEPIINKYMYSQIITTGIFTTLLSLAFLRLPIFADLFRNDQRYLLTAFFGLFIFAGVFNSLNARTYRLNLFAYLERNKMFIGIMLAVSLLQLLIIYHGGTVFRTTGLSLRELAIVIALSSTVIIFDLLRKIFLRIYNRKGFL